MLMVVGCLVNFGKLAAYVYKFILFKFTTLRFQLLDYFYLKFDWFLWPLELT